MSGIVYLIQPYEFLNTNIYKIGCSKCSNLSRVKNGYKKGTRYIHISECYYPFKLENKIKIEFKSKYTLKQGREYFEGDEINIINDFINIIHNYTINKNEFINNNTITNNKNINLENNNFKVRCKYCNIEFEDKRYIKKHLRVSCKKIPISKKKILLEKYSKNKKHLHNTLDLDINNTICKYCNKDFKYVSKLKSHLSRKKPCYLESNNIKKSDIDKNIIKVIDNNIFKCKYCNKNIFYKKNYKKHLRETCEEIPICKKKKLLEKYSKNKKHLLKVSNNNSSTINNTQNNNNITNSNNNINTTNDNSVNTTNNILNNQQYAINVNPVGKEDISQLDDEKLIEFLGEGTTGFTNFVSSIYKFKENRNIYIKSRRDNMVQFINKDLELDIGNLDEVISNITLSHHNKFEKLFDIHFDKLSKIKKTKFQRANNAFNNNPEKFERNTYLCLVNINDINKKYINKFLKIKNPNGEDQVLIGKLDYN